MAQYFLWNFISKDKNNFNMPICFVMSIMKMLSKFNKLFHYGAKSNANYFHPELFQNTII